MSLNSVDCGNGVTTGKNVVVVAVVVFLMVVMVGHYSLRLYYFLVVVVLGIGLFSIFVLYALLYHSNVDLVPQ